ncbi:MAG TPA: SAM-dependent methyltransferase [Candidatus Acidoferrales bacterium]|nr:SAM-dependent methyltransferase [Candidatus Acidoferrales bacterium]
MSATSPANENLIRNISDTARWVAVYRARETERKHPLFRDPYARRLAGERGEQIAKVMPMQGKGEWPFVMRTFLFDEVITNQLQQGVETVINLAAGLDTRPYRMPLQHSVKWYEIDLPEILDYKEEILKNEKPRCSLERIRLDLSDVSARRSVFEELGRKSSVALIVTEGLLAYLEPEQVGVLGRDLTVPASFQRWVNDFGSPGLMRMLQKQIGSHLDAAKAPFKFGPAEGPDFFRPHGWKPVDIHSLLKAAARFNRLPLFLRLLAFLPESRGKQGSAPWSAVCLFDRV